LKDSFNKYILYIKWNLLQKEILTLNDKELIIEIFKNKEDYLIWVQDKFVFAEHRIEKTSYSFSIYGSELVVFLFEYLGFDTINAI